MSGRSFTRPLLTLRLVVVLPCLVGTFAAALAALLVPGVSFDTQGVVLLAAAFATAALSVALVLKAHATTRSWFKDAGASATEFAAGRFGRLVPVPPIAELASLAQRMNSMASAMEDTTRRLRRLAFHDTLTGLPNRAYFMATAEAQLKQCPRAGTLAVLFIDLDRFKLLNDSLGHATGDSLLRAVGGRLQAVTADIAIDIVHTLERPINLSGQEVFSTASIGLAVNEMAERSVTEIMRKADVALYRAKALGRSRYTTFDPSLDKTSAEQVRLDSDLRGALARGEFAVFYQPEIDLRSGEFIGMEALLRWKHPRRGILSPADFIELAQETGQIIPIGTWVLQQACKDASGFAVMVPAAANLRIAVNVSATEFREPNFVNAVDAVVRSTGVGRGRLQLELTETVIMEDVAAAAETLTRLREIGVGSAIDDFGTGYSSLNYLQTLPVDTIKIDQSFIARVGSGDRSSEIVEAVIRLGRALDLHVVAEGIETRQQADFLRATACHSGQGYYFSQPLAAPDFLALLQSRDGFTAYCASG